MKVSLQLHIRGLARSVSGPGWASVRRNEAVSGVCGRLMADQLPEDFTTDAIVARQV